MDRSPIRIEPEGPKSDDRGLSVAMAASQASVLGPQSPAHKLRWPWILAAVMFIALAAYLYWLMQRPAVGVIMQTKVAAEAAGKVEVKWQDYDGRMMAFSYPGNLSQTKHLPNGEESVVEYANDHGTKQLAVTIMKNPLLEDSSVTLRRLKREKYVEEDRVVGGKKWLVFTNLQDGWEMTGFTDQGPYDAGVALTDPNGKDHTAEFDRILESFRWK